ncbi:MAG TPA: hypothetical protein VMU94_21605 [Streptosporangiaceae bacterium]|nr:hypothetical protein [Streptosporangiaceae bacterium]
MGGQADAEFTEFMLGCWPRLVRLGHVLSGDRGLAEDLAQTALARAYASWPQVARAGAVPNSISYLKFVISDGRTTRVPAVAAGRESFYAFALGAPNLRVVRWDAYDSAGRRVVGGRGLP